MKDSPTTGHNDAGPSHGGTGTDLAAPEGTALENRFANPGLPAHRFRTTDTDPKAARNAERQVSTIFLLSFIGTVVFLVGYFALPIEDDKSLGRLQLSTLVLGLGLGFAIFCIGIGLVHWAKTLMPDHEQVELRHDIRGTDEDRAPSQTAQPTRARMPPAHANSPSETGPSEPSDRPPGEGSVPTKCR